MRLGRFGRGCAALAFSDGDAALARHGIEQVDAPVLDEDRRVAQRVLRAFRSAVRGFLDRQTRAFPFGFGPQDFFRLRRLPSIPVACQFEVAAEDALQETFNLQDPENGSVALARVPDALQDICFLQPALLVGLISMVTGHALQEDIAASTRSFLTRGEDILRMTPRSPEFPIYENKTHPLPRPVAARAPAI